jgi:hypothetical protein
MQENNDLFVFMVGVAGMVFMGCLLLFLVYGAA